MWSGCFLSDWLDYTLTIVMIVCAVIILVRPCTKVEIIQGYTGSCVSEYNYKVDKVCLYYNYSNYVYMKIEDNETNLTASKKETHENYSSFPK